MWIFQDLSASQILREINFGHYEAPKNSKFRAAQKGQNDGSIWGFKMTKAKLIATKSRWHKNPEISTLCISI